MEQNLKKRKIKKLPSYLDDEEFLKVLSVTKKPYHKLAFSLAFNSGLRISEIINLKKEDINLKSKTILIRQGKGGKDRIAPLQKGFKETYLKEIPIKCKVRALETAFKIAINKAHINKEGLHFHSLRHSFAVRSMKQGIPLNQIQLILGHENIATTSIYLRVNPSEALKSYEDLW